jgi:YbbR domain-containing protein
MRRGIFSSKSPEENPRPKSENGPGNFYVFFLCLTFSLFFWLITVFNREYTTSISFATRFLNLPPEKILVNKLPKQVSVEVSGTGFELIGANFNAQSDTLFVDAFNVNKLYNESANEHSFLLLNNQLPLIARQLGDRIKVNRIEPDTVKFSFGQKSEKRVPVKLNIKLSFAPQYQQSAPLKINPSSVVVRGPGIWLEDIDILETAPIVLRNLNKTTAISVPLQIEDKRANIEYATKTIRVEIPVERYTEKILEVPVVLTNAPAGYIAKSFPAKIRIKFNTSLSLFNQIKVSDFEIYADLKSVENAGSQRLKLKVIRQPEGISGLKLLPEKVEYVIRKP